MLNFTHFHVKVDVEIFHSGYMPIVSSGGFWTISHLFRRERGPRILRSSEEYKIF